MPRSNIAKSALGQLVNAVSHSAPGAEGAAFTQLFNAAKSRALSTAANRTVGRIAGNGAKSVLQPCTCGKVLCPGHGDRGFSSSAAASAEAATNMFFDSKAPSLGDRLTEIRKSFPEVLAVDDWMARVEQALAGFGFTGDNSIAMSNLCRDECCLVLEDKIESTFGSCFSTHGLGGVLTCGVIGIKAGLSHSPVVGGKERYVFFSFPHIGIDSEGKIGTIARPNRAASSSACGALIAVTGQLKSEGLEAATKAPGQHDPLEPEYSILKQRIARRMAYEKIDPTKTTLVDVTKVAERVITNDLEYLISKAVDTKKADYAVFTGVQVHNWSSDLAGETPSIEFISLGKSYVVVDGEKLHLDLKKVPTLSPRQLQVLANTSLGIDAKSTASVDGSTIQEIPKEYLLKRLGGVQSSAHMTGGAPAWAEYVRNHPTDPYGDAPKMDTIFTSEPPKDGANTSFFWKK